MQTDFEKAASAIMSLGMNGKRCGYEIMRDMLKVHSHPERGHKIIHIAGTNGKGSTAFYISKILEANGCKVGLYTSPHLIRLTERIRVCSSPIPENDFVRISKEFVNDKGATASDVLLLVALKYFTEKNCDHIVIETGLGGSLDSTNALTDEDMGGPALITMITRIGLDHTALLGDTIESIAYEKSCIIKPGTKAVISENSPLATDVITARCRKAGVTPIFSSENTGLFKKISEKLPELNMTYQRENIATAITGAELLKLDIPWDVLRGVTFYGRFQVFKEDPLIIVDGAHNPNGACALAKSVAARYPGRQFDCVIGIVKDKDSAGITEPLLSVMRSAVVVETGPGLRRTDGRALVRQLKGQGIPTVQKKTVSEALEYLSGKDVLIFGSLYLAGEAISIK